MADNNIAAVVVMDDDAVVIINTEAHELGTVDNVEEQVIDDMMHLVGPSGMSTVDNDKSMVSEGQQQVAIVVDEVQLERKQRLEIDCFGGVISTSDEEEVKDDKDEGVGATKVQPADKCNANNNNDDNKNAPETERSSTNEEIAQDEEDPDYERHDRGKVMLISEYKGSLISSKERLENMGTLFCLAISHVEENRKKTMYQPAQAIFNLAERSYFSDNYENRMSLKNIHVGGQIGEGTYGRVFSAFINKRHVALKQCLRRKNRFENVVKERDVMIKLKHPYVCNLLGAFYEYHCYLVLEICVGGVSEVRKMASIRHVHCFVVQLLKAIEWIHGNEIIHCDLRPDNILVTSNGCLKVSDFGTAQILEPGITCIKRSRIYGVAAYQDATTNQECLYSKSSDLFSVACTIFEIDTQRGLQLYPRYSSDQKDVSVGEYVNCFIAGRKITTCVEDLFNPNTPRMSLRKRIETSKYSDLLNDMLREPRVGARKALLHDVLKHVQSKNNISDEMIKFGHPIAMKKVYKHEKPIYTEHKKEDYGMVYGSMAVLYYDAGVELDNLIQDEMAYNEARAKSVKDPEEDVVFKIRKRLLASDRNMEQYSSREIASTSKSSDVPAENVLIEVSASTTAVELKKPQKKQSTKRGTVEKVSETTAQDTVVAKGKFVPPVSAASELAASISEKLKLPTTKEYQATIPSSTRDPEFAAMIKAAMMQAIAEFNSVAAPTTLELRDTSRTAPTPHTVAREDGMWSPRVTTTSPPPPPQDTSVLESEFLKYWATQPPPPPVDTSTTTTTYSSVKGKIKPSSKKAITKAISKTPIKDQESVAPDFSTVVPKTKGRKSDKVSSRSKDGSVSKSGKQPASSNSGSVTPSTSKGGEKRKRSTSGDTLTITTAAAANTTPTVEAQPFKKPKSKAEQKQQSEEELKRLEENEERCRQKREAQRKQYEQEQMREQKEKKGKQKRGHQTIMPNNKSPEYECPVKKCGYESVTEQEMEEHIKRAHKQKQKKRHDSSSDEVSE